MISLQTSAERADADRRVLLVEDDRANAATIRRCLGPSTRVTHRSTLAQALGVARRHSFDVALARVSPRNEGHAAAVGELASLMRFPVVLLGEDDVPELAKMTIRTGALDYLVREQLQPDPVLHAISTSMRRHEALIQYRRLLESCPDGVMIVNREGVVLMANPAALAAFEINLIGRSFGFPIATTEATEIELRGGRTAEMRAVEVPWEGSVAQLVMLRDVSDRVEAVANLRRLTETFEAQALLDPLTKVLNRRGMDLALAQALAACRDGRTELSAILLDCDNFKTINDANGYAAGDATLQLVAATLSSTVRAGVDRVGRIGGDEFLVLLPGLSLAEARRLAEQIRLAVHKTPLAVSAALERHRLSVSLGVTRLPRTVGSVSEVVAMAQGQLRMAKHHGKNCVGDRADGHRLMTAASPKSIHALIRDPLALSVAAQPIVSPRDGTIGGYELLVRGPAGEPLESPDALFLSARREGVATAADLLCLRRCVEASGRIAARSVDINIYPSTLMDTPMSQILDILQPAAMSQLVLELNEQEFMGDPKLILPQLRTLRNAGIRIGLDDVGFGRSSFETLLVVEPEVVKIDRLAVTGVAGNAEQRQVLARMVGCIASLGAEIIVEGVETEADARVIADLGILLAQGYVWGRPELVLGNVTRLDRPEGDLA